MVDERDAPPLPFTGGRYPASIEELSELRRRVWRLHIAAPSACCIALIAGLHLEWPILSAGSLIGVGLVLVAIGVPAMIERRLFFYVRNFESDRYRYVIYEGLAAVPIGFALLTAGASLIALVTLYLLADPVQTLRDRMLARPSLVLVPVGLVMTATGLGFAIGFSHPARTIAQRIGLTLLNMPARIAGLILLVQGAVVLAIGLLEGLSPAAFDQAFQWIFDNPWPFRPR
jgi:hypothetical protein